MGERDVQARTNMVILVLCLTYLSCAEGHSSVERRKTRSSGRVVGGENATRFEFPSVVQLVIASGRFAGLPNCAASVINRDWVVTAAHCVLQVNDQNEISIVPLDFYYVRAGNINLIPMPGEQILNITRIVPHPKFYTGYFFQYDIALLQVHPEIKFGKYVQPINLPKCREEILPGPGEGEVLYVGWGRNKTPTGNEPYVPTQTLQKIKVELISNEQCEKDAILHGFPGVPNSVLCIKNNGEQGSCFGDSGGPTYLRMGHTLTQLGLTSGGTKICESGWTFLTKMSYYIGWIHRRIAGCGNFAATPWPQAEGEDYRRKGEQEWSNIHPLRKI